MHNSNDEKHCYEAIKCTVVHSEERSMPNIQTHNTKERTSNAARRVMAGNLGRVW